MRGVLRPAASSFQRGAAVLTGLLWISAAALPALAVDKHPVGEGGTPSKSPVRIQSEHLVADMNANTAEFSDQVRVVDDTYTVTADILTIHFKPQAEGQSRMQSAVSAQDISRMVARGRVVLRTESITARAAVAAYEPDTGLVTLSGEGAGSAAAKTPGGIAADGRPTPAAEAAPGRVHVTVMPAPDRR